MCLDGSCHMTKNGYHVNSKYLLKSSNEPMALKLDVWHRVLE